MNRKGFLASLVGLVAAPALPKVKAGAPSPDPFSKLVSCRQAKAGDFVCIISGKGTGQIRRVKTFDPQTHTVTFCEDWDKPPDATSFCTFAEEA